MYVIVEIAGLQYKVEQNQQLYVHRLKGEIGDSVSFDKVLLSDNGSITIGAPAIDGLAVQAKIVDHVKGDKVIVFKKKRRKGYKVKNGHRQYLSLIEILSIGAGSGSAKTTTSKTTKAKATTESAAVAAPNELAEKPAKASKKATAGDNIEIVEGIGPKVREIFNAEGIVSFVDLAAKTPAELRAILEPKGGIYAAMDPDTWPKQAQLAAEGKMEELKAWQDELNAGK